MRHVACPVALHPDGHPLRVAAFHHPEAGLQLVNDGLRARDRPEQGAARALFEESGLETRATVFLGASDTIIADERWHFTLCRIKPPVRAAWKHLCADGSGHVFAFFWQELDAPLEDECDKRYLRALDWIASAIAG